MKKKRTAITSAGIFLQIKERVLEVTQKELMDFTLALATKKADFETGVEWFKRHSRSPR